MHYMRQVIQAIGAFWAITILTIVTVGLVIGGLTVGGYLFVHNVAAPLGKNLDQQRVNNAYQVTKDSQAYQDTYHSRADQMYQQITADKYNLSRDKADGQSPTSDVIQGDYAMITNDITAFCKAAGNLTPTTLDTMGPNELELYHASC